MKTGYFLILLSVWLGVGVAQVPAQGSSAGALMLRTGGSIPLVTAVRTFPQTSAAGGLLEFDFAFGTDESYGPGSFFDSFTITVQDETGQNSFVIVTADASGVVWAPATPGGLVVAADVIVRTPMEFPSLDPVAASGLAFHVAAPLPAVFGGQNAQVFLDLYSNLNGVESVGWFRGIVVPEPNFCLLSLLGGLAWLFFRHARK